MSGGFGYPCPKCRKETNWPLLPDDYYDDSEDSEAEADLKFAASTKGTRGKEHMSLDEWTVYAADSPSIVLPQQVEAEVCIWLKTMAWQLGMVNNPERLYGNIIFDSLGELFDFEVRCLSLEMLSHGFGNWMNTLSSGEILLDIVNGLIEHIPKDAKISILPYKWTPLPIQRMVHTAPNKHAVLTFLLNHDGLLRDFLGKLMKVLRPVDNPTRSKLPLDLRQTVRMLRHIGHTLLRNSHTMREWTWKGLMLVVMTLMALTGSLDNDLHGVFCRLTSESQAKISELKIPELEAAHLAVCNKKVAEPQNFRSTEDFACGHFPYKRVLKQGVISFKSQLAMELGLE